MEGPPKKKMRGSPVKGSPLKGSPKKDAKGKGSPKKTVTVTTPPQHASEAPLTPPAPTLGSPAKHGSPLAPTLSPPGSPRVVGEDDVKGALEDAYGMPMPAELAAVWSIALRCRAKSPVEAFASLGVRLVGPFEVLSGHLASDIDVHMQWRYKHDPPETMTVLTDATTNRPVKHWCYHRDDPAKLPTMVVKGNKGMGNFLKRIILFQTTPHRTYLYYRRCLAFGCVIRPQQGDEGTFFHPIFPSPNFSIFFFMRRKEKIRGSSYHLFFPLISRTTALQHLAPHSPFLK